MVVEASLAAGLAIAAVIIGTIVRTFLPLGMKILAEIQAAEAEKRDPVPPKFHWLYGAAALVNIAILGIPMLANLNGLSEKIINAVDPTTGFFIVLGLAIAGNELINRMVTVTRPQIVAAAEKHE